MRAGTPTQEWTHGRTGLIVVAVGVLAISCFISCQESLPPRNDPSTLVVGVVRGSYVYQPLENDVHFTIGLVNIFDETLQDTADLHGALLLTLLRKPSVTRVLSVSADSLLPYQSGYNPITHVLTLNPGDTVWMRARWDMKDDRGRDLVAEEFHLLPDPTCPGRGISYEEDFLVAGYVQVFFHHAQVRLTPAYLRLCYVYPWVGPTFCPKPPTTCEQWK